MYDTNYVSEYISRHKSTIFSMLQVITVCWESRLQPCELQRAGCRRLQHCPRLRVCQWLPLEACSNTQTYVLRQAWILKSFLMWGNFTREQNKGCNSWTPRLALCPGHIHSTCPVASNATCPKQTQRRKENSIIMGSGVVQGVLNRTQWFPPVWNKNVRWMGKKWQNLSVLQ